MAKGVPIYKLTQTDKKMRASASVLLVRLSEMMEWAESVHDPARVEELHNMRIAAKRLRYTLEVFAPALGDEANSVLETVAALQEQLGLIHDCDVLVPLLTATMEKEAEVERKKSLKKGATLPPYLAAEGLSALIARKKEERETRYADFIKTWEALPPASLTDRFNKLVGDVTDSKDAA